jgi:phospholipid-binding lipoprotein MlaA
MRVAVNSTFGLGGVIDIASPAGLQKHKEDFGQTLGVWGVPSGPYIVLPMLGSSTLRDTAAMPVDMKADLWSYKEPVYPQFRYGSETGG